MPASCGWALQGKGLWRSGSAPAVDASAAEVAGSIPAGPILELLRGFGFWGLMSRGAKCPVRKGAGRGKGVGGRADSRLQGFGFWGSMSRAQGAGRGARGARRGKGSGGGRGWARGALGTATRAAAPGDGRGGGP